MKFRVVVTARARADTIEAFRWLVERSPDAASRCRYLGLEEAIASLAAMPERHPVAEEESDQLGFTLRQMLYGRRRGTYRILFSVEQDTVTLEHYVRDSAQGPIEHDVVTRIIKHGLIFDNILLRDRVSQMRISVRDRGDRRPVAISRPLPKLQGRHPARPTVKAVLTPHASRSKTRWMSYKNSSKDLRKLRCVHAFEHQLRVRLKERRNRLYREWTITAVSTRILVSSVEWMNRSQIIQAHEGRSVRRLAWVGRA